ncbi:hypothetical protein PMIN05_012617 [Paraphaeosphaeria minitans]
MQLISRDGATARLLYVSWEIKADTSPDGQPQDLLGLALFSDGTYGPHTATIHALRDALQGCHHVQVHFYTAAGSWFEDAMNEVSESIQTQVNVDTMAAWYPRQAINIQLGMQLPPDERPKYSIPAREQFDCYEEYFTVHFYSAIAEYEAIPNAVFVPTKVRLVEIGSNLDQRAYFALIVMDENINLRVDALFDIQFLGDDASDSMAWRGRVVPPVGIANGLEHSAFIRRPHNSRSGFQQDPKFSEDHVVKANNFDDIDQLRAALDNHPGIEVYIRVKQPQNQIKREIDTLRMLFQQQDKYEPKLDLLLNNNMLNLPDPRFLLFP